MESVPTARHRRANSIFMVCDAVSFAVLLGRTPTRDQDICINNDMKEVIPTPIHTLCSKAHGCLKTERRLRLLKDYDICGNNNVVLIDRWHCLESVHAVEHVLGDGVVN